MADGKRVPATFAAADDHSIANSFTRPNALFICYGNVITAIGASPAHFLKQFHPKYGDKAAIDALIAANTSWDDWTQVMTDKDSPNLTIDRPTHEPWIKSNV